MTIRTIATGVVLSPPTRMDPDDPESEVTFALGTRQSIVYRQQILDGVDAVETCYVTCDRANPEGRGLGEAVLNHVRTGDPVIVEGDIRIERSIFDELDERPDPRHVNLELFAASVAIDVRAKRIAVA